MTPPPPTTTTTVRAAVLLFGSTLLAACAATPPRPKPVAAVSINEDENEPALGNVVDVAINAEVPTALRGVATFTIADREIVDGVVVPSQGLVLIPKREGSTTATLRAADGAEQTVTINVKASEQAESAPRQIENGSVVPLGNDPIAEWVASPPGSLEVVPNTNGVGSSAIAKEIGEGFTLLLRFEDGRVKLLRFDVVASSSGP